MKIYRVVNSDYNPVPVTPFNGLDEAKRYILVLLEVYSGPFHVIELNVVYTLEK